MHGILKCVGRSSLTQGTLHYILRPWVVGVLQNMMNIYISQLHPIAQYTGAAEYAIKIKRPWSFYKCLRFKKKSPRILKAKQFVISAWIYIYIDLDLPILYDQLKPEYNQTSLGNVYISLNISDLSIIHMTEALQLLNLLRLSKGIEYEMPIR